MALSATTITAAIAALTITGVTIKDISGIPDQVLDRDCPILFPMPGTWLGAGSGLPDEETTFGTPSTRYWVAHRVYKYVFLHSIVGAGRGVSEQYNAATAYMDSIPTALVQLDVATVDVEGITFQPLGVVQGPDGTKFIGSVFDIAMRERINQ
jgi:hypothetical protein